MITLSNYTGSSFLAINGPKKPRDGLFRTFGGAKRSKKSLMICEESTVRRRNESELSSAIFMGFRVAFLLCMQGNNHCLYPPASHGHHRADQEDKLLDSAWQLSTWRYKQRLHGHIIQIFLERLYTSVVFSIALCLVCGIFLLLRLVKLGSWALNNTGMMSQGT